MLIIMLRRKSHTFYSSEREFTNNFTNDTKGSLAKDLIFLRKLEHYLKDGETTRE